ncbi:MAG: threonylcarbamoyl-AMP synthase [Acetobacteraceae bacterium]|nr:threonylcarbamoyl-AMP synthase [Acetobacteraceae bacterium]
MTELLAANEPGIARAAALLRAGELVAFGTETVYGLGVDATNATAVARIFEVKGRPRFNPLIAHYPDPTAAFADVIPDPRATQLAAAFWPGPLTLVLPRRPESRIAPLVSAGLDTIAVRVPGTEIARMLLREAGVPVAAPSANPSGRLSPTAADHVLAALSGRIAAVLDTGPCQVGVESTVLDLIGEEPVLLRPGGIPTEAVAAVIGSTRLPQTGGTVRAPGMLASHYAPAASLRLEAHHVAEDEALLAFGAPLPGTAVAFNLSPARSLTEAAARLFAGLRALDAEVAARGLRGIAAMPIPTDGMGLAINDRLRRAAAPRTTLQNC